MSLFQPDRGTNGNGKADEIMKVLHILNDGPKEFSSLIIEAHSRTDEVKVIDLSKGAVSYDAIVEEIFACDRVISW